MRSNITITPHPRDYHGGFIATIAPMSEVNFLGSTINELELLERLGALPHNNILGNALIKTFGSRVLDLIYKQRPGQQKEDNSLLCATYADEMELRCTWRMTEILMRLKDLERNLHSETHNISLSETTGVSFLPELKMGEKNNSPKNIQTLDSKLKTLEANIEKIIKNKINEFKGETTVIAKQRILKSLYQAIIEQFELQQAAIFTHQRQAQTQMAIANGTNTNTTQAAYKLVREHVFSQTPVSDQQLYQAENTKKTQNPIQLDTTLLPSVKPERLLKALSLISACKDQNTDLIKTIKNKFKQEKKNIKTAHINLKNQIDTDRKQFSTGFEWVLASLNLYRDRTVMRAMRNKNAENNKLNQAIQELLNPNQQTEPTSTSINQTRSNFEFLLERPAIVYRSHDLVSAISSFGKVFFQYFDDLATRHPILFSSSFLIPQIYGMAYIAKINHVSPAIATSITEQLSRVLSLNNHLITADNLTYFFNELNKNWLILTNEQGFSKQATMILALSKFNYVFFDMVLNIANGLDEGTILNLEEELTKKGIDTNTSSDELNEKINMVAKQVILLSLALGLGFCAPHIHGFVGADYLKDLIEFFDPSQQDTIKRGIFDGDVLARFQAVFGLQTAGFFLAKIYAISHFSNNTHHQEKLDALSYFIALFNSKKSDEQTAKNTSNSQEKEEIEKEEIEKHKTLLVKLFKEHPELEFYLDPTFIGYLKSEHEIKFNSANTLEKIAKFFWLLTRKIFGTAWTYIIGAISIIILPALYITKYIIKKLFNTKLQNNELLLALTAYLEKRCLKLIKTFILLPIVYAFWPVKIISIGLYRSLTMLLISSLALVLDILITIFNTLRLDAKGQLENSAKYLGLKLMSASLQVLTPVIRLLETLSTKLIIKPLIFIAYLLSVLALSLLAATVALFYVAFVAFIPNEFSFILNTDNVNLKCIYDWFKDSLSQINEQLKSSLVFVNTNKNFVTHAMDNAKIEHVNKSPLIQEEWGRKQVNQCIAWFTCGSLRLKQAVGKPFFLLNLYVMGGLDYHLQKAHRGGIKHPMMPAIKHSARALFKTISELKTTDGTPTPCETFTATTYA